MPRKKGKSKRVPERVAVGGTKNCKTVESCFLEFWRLGVPGPWAKLAGFYEDMPLFLLWTKAPLNSHLREQVFFSVVS